MDRRVHTFLKNICLKVNFIAQLEFEHGYFGSTESSTLGLTLTENDYALFLFQKKRDESTGKLLQ